MLLVAWERNARKGRKITGVYKRKSATKTASGELNQRKLTTRNEEYSPDKSFASPVVKGLTARYFVGAIVFDFT
jgi:hypothetical protein